jgi:hypothetical protein
LAALTAAAALCAGDPALAADLAPIPAMPTTKVPPRPNAAVLYALKVRLPEGQGLARLLMDAGVSQEDAAAAAKLAAGHLGGNTGGCDVKVEISNTLVGGGYRLERAVLLTASSQTTIERREGKLAIAAQQAATTSLRFV